MYTSKLPVNAAPLTDPRFRHALTQMVRQRVPEHDAEDIVQSALAEALAAPHAPGEADALRRFVWGIARHKVADFHRRARRELLDVPEVEGAAAPHVEADLLRWVERELPPGADAARTLEWMLREGEGEKLEAIADGERVPAPRVRQRVSRLRRHLRQRWAIELAALAAIGAIVALIAWEITRRPGAPITNDAHPPTLDVPRTKEQAPPKSLPGSTEMRSPDDPALRPRIQDLPPSVVPSSSAPRAMPPAPSSTVPSNAEPRSAKPGPSKTKYSDSSAVDLEGVGRDLDSLGRGTSNRPKK